VIDKIPPVKKLLHGAQKPAALYCELLSRSANPGDTVLDCFAGTGPILVAANRMQLTATYIEIDETAYNIALGRSTTGEFDDGSVEDDGLGDVPV
jgi:DNA modification methylase